MSWLPSAIVFACIGFVVTALSMVLAFGLAVHWLASQCLKGWAWLRKSGWTGRYWASLTDAPRPAVELPKRYPAPPVFSPRPDLEAALRSEVRALNHDIDDVLGAALPGPSGDDIEQVLIEAIRATRHAANLRLP